MSVPAGIPWFDSLEAFYAERGGSQSDERDFGCWWYDGEQAWSGCWRVSTVSVTGDVYAVKERLGGRTIDEPAVGTVVLLGNIETDPGFARANVVLAGWEAIVGQTDSLEWALSRVRLAAGQLAVTRDGRPAASLEDLAHAAAMLLVALRPWAMHGEEVQHRAAELGLVLARLDAAEAAGEVAQTPASS